MPSVIALETLFWFLVNGMTPRPVDMSLTVNFFCKPSQRERERKQHAIDMFQKL